MESFLSKILFLHCEGITSAMCPVHSQGGPDKFPPPSRPPYPPDDDSGNEALVAINKVVAKYIA